MRSEVHEAVAPLAAEWEELADAVAAPPFLRPGWFNAYARSFGQGRPAVVAVRRPGGGLVGVAALERSRLALRAQANWHTPAWAPVAADATAAHAVAEAVVRAARPWLSAWFLDPQDGAQDAFLAAARDAGCPSRLYPLEHSPHIPITGAVEAFFERLPAKRRSNLRRLRRRLEERGELSFEVRAGTERLDALLEEAFAVEASGWKGRGGTAVASGGDTRTFYRDVGRWAADRGWLRLAFLRLDGRAIAADVALEAAGTHWLLKTGYDEQWRSYAPGVVLREAMVRRAFEEGLHAYEFLGDQAEWKREWTEASRPRNALELFAPGITGRAAWAAWAYGRPAFNRVRARVRR